MPISFRSGRAQEVRRGTCEHRLSVGYPSGSGGNGSAARVPKPSRKRHMDISEPEANEAEMAWQTYRTASLDPAVHDEPGSTPLSQFVADPGDPITAAVDGVARVRLWNGCHRDSSTGDPVLLRRPGPDTDRHRTVRVQDAGLAPAGTGPQRVAGTAHGGNAPGWSGTHGTAGANHDQSRTERPPERIASPTAGHAVPGETCWTCHRSAEVPIRDRHTAKEG
ncbi:hypothetical protein JCM9534A_17890 [Catenuloplanes indicus JCM 9534]